MAPVGIWKYIDYFVVFVFFADFIFRFFEEFEDKETFQKIRDHKKIAIKYFKSGWMFLDFIATFPFDLIEPNLLITKLVRLLRLTKLVNLLDESNFKHLIKSFFENSTRSDRI